MVLSISPTCIDWQVARLPTGAVRVPIVGCAGKRGWSLALLALEGYALV
jgi:hypothetical protein